MTEEEYNEMYERIRKELMEEMMKFEEIQIEQNSLSERPEDK